MLPRCLSRNLFSFLTKFNNDQRGEKGTKDTFYPFGTFLSLLLNVEASVLFRTVDWEVNVKVVDKDEDEPFTTSSCSLSTHIQSL
jgi:hypothetical protein